MNIMAITPTKKEFTTSAVIMHYGDAKILRKFMCLIMGGFFINR